MFAAIVMVITTLGSPPLTQDTSAHRDTTHQAPTAPPASPAAPTTPPTLEQIRYMEGLRSVTRGLAQIRDGLNRVLRTQQKSDSVTRRRAARRLGGLCGTARSFIVSGRPKMQANAYSDSLRILAKQVTVRLDSLTSALPQCEKTAGHDPNGVATTLTARLKSYDDALLTFRTALKPDSTKAATSSNP